MSTVRKPGYSQLGDAHRVIINSETHTELQSTRRCTPSYSQLGDARRVAADSEMRPRVKDKCKPSAPLSGSVQLGNVVQGEDNSVQGSQVTELVNNLEPAVGELL